jgi:Sec-independent protein secretion pathway component TatC
MALLAVPMYALYELSIWVILPLERRWRASTVILRQVQDDK